MMRSVLNVIDRSPNYMDLMFRVDPSTSSYRLLFATSVNDSYDLTGGAGTNGVVGLFAPFQYPVDFQSGTSYRSKKIARRGLTLAGETMRGQTRVLLDLSEFYGPANPSVPDDHQMTFVRVQEFNRAANAWLPPGPIHIIPPPNFYGNIPAGLTLAGTAPNTGGLAGRPLSDNAMWISLPRYCGTSETLNRDNSADLLVAWDYGQTCGAIEANGSLGLNNTSYKNLLLEGVGAAVEWTSFLSIVGTPN